MPIVIENGVTIEGGISITGGSVPTSPINLDTIATYLRNYTTTLSTSGGLRNPEFYEYALDGDEYSISDGGDDMFDGGNYTAPYLLDNTTFLNDSDINIPPALSYDTLTTAISDTNFNYVSLGYANNRRPLTMLGTRVGVGLPIGFQKAGNLGSDGGGSFVDGNLYTGQTLNNFTTHAWYRQSYGQSSDPACCDLYILLGHAAWGSVFGTTTNALASTPRSEQGGLFYTYGGSVTNVLAITTLLSKNPGAVSRELDAPTIQQIVQNYTYLIGQALGI